MRWFLCRLSVRRAKLRLPYAAYSRSSLIQMVHNTRIRRFRRLCFFGTCSQIPLPNSSVKSYLFLITMAAFLSIPSEQKTRPVEENSPLREHVCMFCPTCSTRLDSARCKLICRCCGYYMSCADYY